MVGPRQRRILDRLASGPCTLNALVYGIDPDHPELAHASVKALAARGLVRVGDRTSKHDLAAWVELAEPVRSLPGRGTGGQL